MSEQITDRTRAVLQAALGITDDTADGLPTEAMAQDAAEFISRARRYSADEEITAEPVVERVRVGEDTYIPAVNVVAWMDGAAKALAEARGVNAVHWADVADGIERMAAKIRVPAEPATAPSVEQIVQAIAHKVPNWLVDDERVRALAEEIRALWSPAPGDADEATGPTVDMYEPGSVVYLDGDVWVPGKDYDEKQAENERLRADLRGLLMPYHGRQVVGPVLGNVADIARLTDGPAPEAEEVSAEQRYVNLLSNASDILAERDRLARWKAEAMPVMDGLRGAAQAFLDAYDNVGVEVWWPEEADVLREALERTGDGADECPDCGHDAHGGWCEETVGSTEMGPAQCGCSSATLRHAAQELVARRNADGPNYIHDYSAEIDTLEEALNR